MTKPIISPTNISTLVDKNFTNLRECLDGGLGLENFKGYYLEGTTSSSPDQEMRLNHSMRPQPAGAIPIVGDVYIQAIDEKSIDVRSTKPAVPFKIFLLTSTDAQKTTAPPVSGDYQDTNSFINFLIEEGDANSGSGNASDGLNLRYSSSSGSSVTSDLHTVLANSAFIMYTRNLSTIVRVERATGTTTELNPSAGATVIGPMCFDTNPNFVWVAPGAGVGGSHTLYKINITTWTVDSTLTSSTETGAGNLNAIYADATHVWVTGRSTNTSERAVIWQRDKSGAGVTSQTLQAISNANGGGRDIVVDGNGLLYCTATGGTAGRIYEIDAAFSSVTNRTYGSPNNRLLMRLWYTAPLVIALLKGTSNAAGSNNAALIAYNVDTDTFSSTEIAVPGVNSISHLDLVVIDNYAYLKTNTASFFQVLKIDLTGAEAMVTRTYSISSPVYGETGPSIPHSPNLVVDYDNRLLVVAQPTSANHIIWFNPDFTQPTE